MDRGADTGAGADAAAAAGARHEATAGDAASGLGAAAPAATAATSPGSRPRYLDWDFLHTAVEGTEYHVQAAGRALARLRSKVHGLNDRLDTLRSGVRTLMAASSLAGGAAAAATATAATPARASPLKLD
jgi:hypothetical protein